MLLLDVDVTRVLEETMPAHFGGGPLDYQLLERVDGDGRAALRLLVLVSARLTREHCWMSSWGR